MIDTLRVCEEHKGVRIILSMEVSECPLCALERKLAQCKDIINSYEGE